MRREPSRERNYHDACANAKDQQPASPAGMRRDQYPSRPGRARKRQSLAIGPRRAPAMRPERSAEDFTGGDLGRDG